MDSSAINWALEDLTSSESPYSNRTCPLPRQLPLLRWGSTLLLSTILLDLSHSKQTDNFTGVSDQRFTATISAQVSINPWSVCQKLLYFCFPHQCLNFLTKLHCWQLSTLILSLLTLPPYPPQSPLVLTSPINILFFSLPHSTTVWTSCKQGLATATHPAPQPVPGGTGTDILFQWSDCLSPPYWAQAAQLHDPSKWNPWVGALLLFKCWHLGCHIPDFHRSHASRWQLQHTSIQHLIYISLTDLSTQGLIYT